MILIQINNISYSDAPHIILFILIGLIVGFLSGLLGKGGSAISTPALQVFAGVSPLFALASPLPASLTTSFSGSLVYNKEKLINKRLVIQTLVWGIPATILGSLLTKYIGGDILMIFTAIFVCGLGISFVIPLFHPGAKHPEIIRSTSPVMWKIIVIAISVGGLSGLLANGGGVLFAPLFIRWLKIPTKEAMASSLLIAGGLAIPGTITHWYLGHIDWWIVLVLSLSSIPSAYFGAKAAIRLNSETLEYIFGAMLCIFGIYDIIYTLFLS